MDKNVVQDMHELTTRILKNRKQMEPTVLKIPYVEVIMAEKPLPPGFIIGMIQFKQQHVTLRQSFYYESDGCYFKHTDEFFARPEILPEHVREKIWNFQSKVDITEEINQELSAL